MADARTLAMMADACLGLQSHEELTADLRGYLTRHGLDAADVDAIASAPPRLAVYRRLVRNNLTDVTWKMLPRTRARMNKLASQAFDVAFDEFLATEAPRTQYLRDVPHEFFAWAAPRWRARPDLPAYLAELGAHELAEFAIAAAPSPADPPPLTDVALHRPLVFDAAARLARYEHAIHELPADVDDTSAPAARPTALLVYRDVDHRVRFLELTPLAATLVEGLLSGVPLEGALRAACDAHGAELDDAVLAAIARLLAELGDRGVLLGAVAA